MSQHDPNRGRRDGPPDLDELFRQLNQKLARLLGAKPPQGGGNSPEPAPGIALKGSLLAAGGVALALWLVSGFYVVDAREQGVVLRLGSFDRLTDSGLQWHFPYPFEGVEIVTLTEVRSVEIGYRGSAQNRVPEESLMLTEDQNIIDVQLSAQYDVKDARAFLFNNLAADSDAKDIVKQAGETAIREVVGKNNVDFVLNEGRGQIAVDTQRAMQLILDRYGLGVRIAKVNINDVQPPAPVQAAFDDAIKAGQDKDKLRNEGLAYANDVIPRAKGLAARLTAEADGYRQRVVATAEGDAARFRQVLPEYNKAPVVTRNRLYFEMMQQVLSNTSKIVVDQKKGSGNILYLPLNQLLDASKPGATLPGAGPAVPPAEKTGPEAANAGEARSGREVTRGRELGGR
ncbi:FtsH protease activity modulator HflK [Crenobacter cavernae]|uniref:Protein HflK n=1 Tax=Crenobacter cavernae TaxID=2290923 RepID=A0ABY0FIA7_9NEIS|nr:FtsH protease activity modulator HflK [Crenobacter cavernae]RXZ45147.1 FtsH protease activity modulator HflK [Crenobacter cavernae]